MLTVTQSTLDALARGCSLSVVVSFTGRLVTNLTTERTFNFCWGEQPTDLACEQILASAPSMSYDLDTKAYTGQQGQVEVHLIDEGPGISFVRDVLRYYHLSGRSMTMRLGVAGSAIADYIPIWGGVIEDPAPTKDCLIIRGRGRGRAPVNGKKVRKAWFGKHPYEIIYDLLIGTGIASGFIDAATFAFDYSSTRSHYVAGNPAVRPWGCATRRVIPEGGFDSALFEAWQIQGVHPGNSVSGKIYPQYNQISTAEVAMKIWRGATNENPDDLTGHGSTRNAGTWTWPIGLGILPTTVAAGTDEGLTTQPSSNGISGGVLVTPTSTAPGDDDVAHGAANYLLVDSSDLGGDIDVDRAIQELCQLSTTAIVERENGQLALVPWDYDAAEVDTWTPDDTIDPTPDGIGEVINTLRLTLRKPLPRAMSNDNAGTVADVTILFERGTSQEAFADTGETFKSLEQAVEFTWCPGNSELYTNITNASTSLSVGVPSYLGALSNYSIEAYFSAAGTGTEVMASQAAGRKAAATRKVYLLLQDNTGREIVSAEGSSLSSIKDSWPVGSETNDDATIPTYQLKAHVNFSGVTRGLFGTAARAWKQSTIVHDITMAVNFADALLDRHMWGCYGFSCSTSLAKIAVQTGDIVKITEPMAYGLGFDGLSARKFQIVSKAVNPEAGKIDWKLKICAPFLATEASEGTPFNRWRYFGPQDLLFNPSKLDLGTQFQRAQDAIPFLRDGQTQHAPSNFRWTATGSPEGGALCLDLPIGTAPSGSLQLQIYTDDDAAGVDIIDRKSGGVRTQIDEAGRFGTVSNHTAWLKAADASIAGVTPDGALALKSQSTAPNDLPTGFSGLHVVDKVPYFRSESGKTPTNLLNPYGISSIAFTNVSSFTNSWTGGVSGFSAPGYNKDWMGFIHLRGAIKGGTMAASAFTLPVGYRPPASTVFAIESDGALGRLVVYSDGTVVPVTPSTNTRVVLEGVTFFPA